MMLRRLVDIALIALAALTVATALDCVEPATPQLGAMAVLATFLGLADVAP